MKRIAGALVLILATAWVADRLVPPPDGRELADSAQVLAADDGMLRLYTTSDGYWRLPIAVDGISLSTANSCWPTKTNASTITLVSTHSPWPVRSPSGYAMDGWSRVLLPSPCRPPDC